MILENPPLQDELKNESLPLEDIELAKVLWNYHSINDPLKKCDAIFILGSNDLRVPTYGAKLFLEGWADYLIVSGGLGNFTKGFFTEPEGDVFGKIALQMGVPEDVLIIENKASNSGENVTYVEKILKEKELDLKTFLILQKPFMQRRAFATIKKWWPEKELLVSSPPLSLEEYPFGPIGLRYTIEIMVGDLQRIIEYPAKGFQIHQDVPENVLDAYHKLVNQGYTSHMIQ
ncbi:MAG: hypothetical protein COA79_06950 [Planctomycetota bacterium]|nr:MAG: hypothetical protein COA79_06950 [Planctomycetota bacterium]